MRVLWRTGVFFGLWLGAVLLAALGTRGLSTGYMPMLPLEVPPLLPIALSFLILLAMPGMLLSWTRPEERLRPGWRELLAALPDLALAWCYVAAVMAPDLIRDSPRVLFYLLPVEGMAAYTAFFLSGLHEFRQKSLGAYLAILGAILVGSLSFVGYLSSQAGSYALFIGFAALIGKRLVLDRTGPVTPGSPEEYRLARCAFTLVLFLFIGLPAWLYFKDATLILVLAVFYFVFMGWMETIWLTHRGRGPVPRPL